jgi:hypothetical protein
VQPRGPEDVQHPPVLRQGVGHQPTDAGRHSSGAQLLEEQHADPAALVLVGDQQRDLGLVGCRPVPPGDGHDETPDLREDGVVVRVAVPGQSSQVARGRLAVGREEPEIDSPVTETGREPAQPVGVDPVIGRTRTTWPSLVSPSQPAASLRRADVLVVIVRG